MVVHDGVVEVETFEVVERRALQGVGRGNRQHQARLLDKFDKH